MFHYLEAGSIYHYKPRDLPTHEFWRVVVQKGGLIRRFTYIEPARFLYDPPGQTEYNARLISAKLVKDPSLHRKRIIKAIFRAKIFEAHGAH